ncbi:MAG: signal peptidase I [Ruminococcus sp.]|nr:signal peptidase I [Ruminococcus sp.]
MTDSRKRSAGFLRELLSFTESLLIALFVITLIFTYIIGIVTIQGDSMKNTLFSGERVIMVKPVSPERGDIVIISATDAVTLGEDGSPVVKSGLQKVIVKRVIAVGGQQLDIDFNSGAVYVDGEKLREDYLALGLTHIDNGAFTYPITVPEGYFFVMGDNRSVSKDSRSVDVGLISREEILGRAFIRISPKESFGLIG